MNAFHANGLSNLLKNPEFQAAIEKRRQELLREHEPELQNADYALQQQILDRIENKLKEEFAKQHCLF